MSKKSFFSLLLISALAHIAFGQAAKSPFSNYGVGEPTGTAMVNNQGMGGVGIAVPQYYYLNNMNPALLVYNSLSTLSAGIIGEKRTIKNGMVSENNSSGNLSYISMAFPIMKRPKNMVTNRWSSSISLMPYSAVNYQLNYTNTLGGGQLTVNESGSGGMNQAVWANGVTINKYLSVGIRSRYLFGARIDQYSNFLTQAPVYQPNVYERQRYSDVNFTGGLSFHMDSLTSKNYKINVGLTYDFKANVKTTYYSRLERLSSGAVVDSVTVVPNKVGNTILPSAIGGGISVARKGWVVGADVIYTDYTQYKDYFGSRAGTQKTMHYAVGGELTPFKSGGNYLTKITYRVGASYDDFPFLIQQKPAKDVGINLGFALPVAGYSSMDFALRIGKRGDLKTNGIAENYFKIYFGATFNDRWFTKRKLD